MHSGAYNLPGVLGRIGAAGARGVQLFFIISAYFIFVSLSKLPMRDGRYQKGTLKIWYLKRFLRFIPLYYLSNIYFLITNGTAPTYWVGSKPCLSLGNILCNFLFLHGWNPYYINSINVNWYIGTLAIFILIAPLLYKQINTLYKAAIALLLSYIVSASIITLLRNLISFGVDNFIWDAYLNNLSIITNLPIICIGILLYFVIADKRLAAVRGNKLLSYSLLCFCLIRIGILFMYGGNLFDYSLAFAGIILSQVLHSSVLLVNPVFSLLGRYSFGIYLSHYSIIGLVQPITHLFENAALQYAACVCCTAVVSLVISMVCVFLFEKPFIKLTDKALPRLEKSNIPA